MAILGVEDERTTVVTEGKKRAIDVSEQVVEITVTVRRFSLTAEVKRRILST